MEDKAKFVQKEALKIIKKELKDYDLPIERIHSLWGKLDDLYYNAEISHLEQEVKRLENLLK